MAEQINATDRRIDLYLILGLGLGAGGGGGAYQRLCHPFSTLIWRLYPVLLITIIMTDLIVV